MSEFKAIKALSYARIGCLVFSEVLPDERFAQIASKILLINEHFLGPIEDRLFIYQKDSLPRRVDRVDVQDDFSAADKVVLNKTTAIIKVKATILSDGQEHEDCALVAVSAGKLTDFLSEAITGQANFQKLSADILCIGEEDLLEKSRDYFYSDKNVLILTKNKHDTFN